MAKWTIRIKCMRIAKKDRRVWGVKARETASFGPVWRGMPPALTSGKRGEQLTNNQFEIDTTASQRG